MATINTSPTSPGNYSSTFNETTGLWDVVTPDGSTVASYATQTDAGTFIADQAWIDDGNSGTPTVAGNETAATAPSSYTPEQLNAIAEANGVAGEQGNITSDSLSKSPSSYTAAELDAIAEAQGVSAGDGPIAPSASTPTQADLNAAQTQAAVKNAQQQQTIAQQRKQINSGDWRVRLRLAPQSRYLYNAPNPGILQPLQVTDGVIFPYTPSIDTSYRANYQQYDLTHSNYRGYFYQNSYVDAINLKCTFTAQDTSEANYLLAVITFFKSVTKMFYGQDAERGAPPPLVYLTGLGQYQFNEHACLVQSFVYNLPDNVDYIRAGSPNQVGLNMLNMRDRQTVSNNTLFGSLNRLAAALLPKGAQVDPPGPPTLGLDRPTYVPTTMDISLTLLPVQTRAQVSKQFSVKKFANGDLIKGGFW